MDMDKQTEIERAGAIVRTIEPKHNPETSCMLMAAAIAGMRGLTMRHIRIGSVFWPGKWSDPYIEMRGGWGCEGYDALTGRLYLSDNDVDEDGSFAGHTWLEPEPEAVIDLMHDYEGPHMERDPQTWKVVMQYIRRPPLERAVKNFWRQQMLAAIKAGAKA